MRIWRACGLLAMAPALFGAGTTAWEMNSYQDFIRGRFQGLSLTRDGRLTVAPKIDTFFSSDQPIVWSMAQGRDGTVYAATGHRGRLYEIDKSGKSKLLWTADQPEIFALAVDASGALHITGWKGLPHCAGKGQRVLRARRPLRLGADGRTGWRTVRGYR